MPYTAPPLPAIVQPPTITWANPASGTPSDLAAIVCPNCGATASKTLVLTIDVQLPDNPSKRLRVLCCGDCTCHFYDSQIPPDYAEPALNNRGRVPFYVQQGAGVSLITRPLTQAAAPPGSTYMEVGCGYGFGLDFALNTRGWHGVGIDPAPLAALGRDALGLPIELRYLRDDDEARGTMDVVMGSEVIEHVTSPAAFVRTLRAMLKPGGLLILTTPNGDDIDPISPPGIIIPLLSPSLHLVIQSTTSLTALLHQAGFAHVEVDVDSHSLVAFASDQPLTLERDHARLRLAFRTHLARRAESLDRGSDMFLGFAGRAFQESVNDGDMAAATQAWALLAPACRGRFGLDLDTMDRLPSAVATCGLEEMARLVPLNLGGLLYSRGIQRLAENTPRAGLQAQFVLAAAAAAAMRRALGELAMEDGQTEDIGWTASAEALLCAAAGGIPDIAAQLLALPPAPAGGVARRRTILGRAIGSLVNAGHYDLAEQVAQAYPVHEPSTGQPLTDEDRDVMFSLAVLGLQPGPHPSGAGDPHAIRSRFARVRDAAVPGDALWLAALRGELQALDQTGDGQAAVAVIASVIASHPEVELDYPEVTRLVNAGKHAAARDLMRRSGLGVTGFAQPGSTLPLNDTDRDTLFFLAILDAEIGPDGCAAGEPAVGRGRFARVRAATPPGSGLWWAALRGELQSLDLLDAQDEAAALTTEMQAAHPDLTLPDDVAARIRSPDAEAGGS